MASNTSARLRIVGTARESITEDERLSELAALWASYERAMRAANLAPGTLAIRSRAFAIFCDFWLCEGYPCAISEIRKSHLEAWLIDLLVGHAINTALGRYRSIRSFFNWLEAEGELERSPTRGLKEPKATEEAPAVLTENEIAALLKACEGTGFAARRETAIIRLLLDTGLRARELVRLSVEDVNLRDETVHVHGKGNRIDDLPLGRKTVLALDRYLRARARHAQAAKHPTALWLSKQGALTYQGMYLVLDKRAEAAGIGHIHPHMFRHSFADLWLAGGGNERELKVLGRWKSPKVMERYGRAADVRRAREAHKRLSPGDRF